MTEAWIIPAQLNEADLQRVHALETELDKLLVVYAPRHGFAALSLEQELNVVLLAYQTRE